MLDGADAGGARSVGAPAARRISTMARSISGRSLALAVAVGMVMALPAEALALLAPGAPAPEAKVEDPDGKPLSMSALRGRPTLVLYEDRGSARQNAALKRELAALARDPRYRRVFALAAVADVSAYDDWPLRGIAEGFIRKRSREAGLTIYCDWDGSFRRAFGIRRGASNVLLIGADGRVLFAAAGALGTAQMEALRRLVKAEVEGAQGK